MKQKKASNHIWEAGLASSASALKPPPVQPCVNLREFMFCCVRSLNFHEPFRALNISMVDSCDLNIQRDFLTSGKKDRRKAGFRSSRRFPVIAFLSDYRKTVKPVATCRRLRSNRVVVNSWQTTASQTAAWSHYSDDYRDNIKVILVVAATINKCLVSHFILEGKGRCNIRRKST